MAQEWAIEDVVEDHSNAVSSPQTLPTFNADAGNSIILCIAVISSGGYRDPSSDPTDDAGSDYNSIGTYQYYDGSYYVKLHIYLANNINQQSNNEISISWAGAYGPRAFALHVSGLATDAQDTGYTPAGNNDATSPHATTSDSTAEDDELVVGLYCDLDLSTTTFTNNTGTVQEQGGISGYYAAVATRHAASAGSINIGVASSNSDTVMCLARALKQPSALAPTGVINGPLVGPLGGPI